jgi:hypothetical protein
MPHFSVDALTGSREFLGVRRKPGYPLQSFYPPQAGKKYFRFYPLRGSPIGGIAKAV